MTTLTERPITERPLVERPIVDHPWEASLGVVWRLARVAGAIIAVSLAWVIALILILPLPAVTAAILRLGVAASRGAIPNPLTDLASAIREGWRPATVTGAIVAGITGVLVLDLWVAGSMPEPLGTVARAALATLAAWWLLLNLYLWPIVAATDTPVRLALRAAVVLSLVAAPRAIGTAVVMTMPLLVLPASPMVLALVAPGLVIGLWARMTWLVIRRYAPTATTNDPLDDPADDDRA